MFTQATQLRKWLIELFSDEELKTLAGDLGVDLENLPGDGKEAKARELVTWAERQGRTVRLVRLMQLARPAAEILRAWAPVRRRVQPIQRTESEETMAEGISMQQAQFERLTRMLDDVGKNVNQLVTQTALLEQRFEQRMSSLEQRMDMLEGRQAPTRVTWFLMAVGLMMMLVLIYAVYRLGAIR